MPRVVLTRTHIINTFLLPYVERIDISAVVTVHKTPKLSVLITIILQKSLVLPAGATGRITVFLLFIFFAIRGELRSLMSSLRVHVQS